MLTKEAKLSMLSRLASKWRLNKVRKVGLGPQNLQHLLRKSPTLDYLNTLRTKRGSARLLASAAADNLEIYPSGFPRLGEHTSMNLDTVKHIITQGGDRPLLGSMFKLDDWNKLVASARKYALGDSSEVSAYNILYDFLSKDGRGYLLNTASKDVARRLSSAFNKFDMLENSSLQLRNINAGVRGILEALRSTKTKV